MVMRIRRSAVPYLQFVIDICIHGSFHTSCQAEPQNAKISFVEKTSGLMIPIEHKKRRYLAFAAIHNIVAPWSKPAAGLGFKQTGDISFDGEKRLFRIGFIGNRLQKPLCIWMLGIF